MPRILQMSDYRKYRLLEIIPGVLVWSSFALAIVLSVFLPLWAIAFIIVFDLFWLFRVLYLMTYLIVIFRKYLSEQKNDWQGRVRAVAGWERIHHLIVLPTHGDTVDVVRTSLKSVVASSYPLDKMIIVIATEEADGEEARSIARTIEAEYGDRFFRFLHTTHPANIKGEVAGKGANTAWAGRKAKELIDELRIPYEDVIVSSFDIDTCVHPKYFSYLTHTFLTHPNPTRTSYQPIPLFNNNIWSAPALTRVAANATTFWLMTEQARPERLFTFSSHSMSFRALVDVDFWQSDIVTEDSRIFLQCLLRYDGDYTVTPMYIPISMDSVKGTTLWQSLVSLYKQQRRWAYGVENFPYMAWNFAKNANISLGMKIRYIWNQLEGVYSWATAPIIIFVLGRLPLYFISEEGQELAIVQNAPHILELLMTAAMIGLLVSAIFSTILLPPRPQRHRFMKVPFMFLQWILFPIVMIAFGSIPATDAQTRLMLGKYLGFWTTKKVR